MRSIGKYKVCQPMCDRGSRRKRKTKGIKNVSEEIMAENFPNPKKEIDIQVLEAGVDMLSHFICV